MTQSLVPLQNENTRRLVELDWLRVLAFGLLILYHVGMLYADDWGWHYKSTYSSKFLTNIMLWSNQWRMSLLFLISGAAVSFLLAKQSWWYFVRKRVPLLLLPLLFGMLVVVVPQVYVEANSKGIIDCPNYWHFWYAYLDQHSPEFADHKTIGAMQLTWNHLWFLPYLLCYTLIIWAIYPILNARWVAPLWQFLRKRISMRAVIFVPILIFFGIGWLLYEKNPVTHNFVHDWFNHARSFFCFVLGFTLVRMSKLWIKFSAQRWYLLPLALLSYAYILFAFNGGSLGDGLIAKYLNGFLWSANGWLWILCIIAWAQHWFTASSPLLRFLNSGVYCFYILHQTLIIIIAYYLVPYKLGPIIEPVLIVLLVALSCLILFEVIKRIPVIPILFGIQNKKLVVNK